MIIGITGTLGAGKGTIVEYLEKQKGFAHFSVRSFLVEEIKMRELPIDRDHMRLVANDLRKMHGPAFIVESLFDRAAAQGGNIIIESIRAVGEAEFLKSHGALLWAVDADRKVRYERNVRRGTETDRVSFEEFCKQEDREMASTESYDMNIATIMRMADHVFQNNAAPEELFKQVEEVLAEVK